MRRLFTCNVHLKIALTALLCLTAANVVIAQDTKPPTQEPGVFTLGGSDASFDPNQPIKPGFQISVSVDSAGGSQHEADLSGVFTVDPTGNITLKLAGNIAVKGLTPSQAADKIAAALKPYVKDPKVTVAIVNVPKPVVFLSGGVTRAGAVTANEGTTLAEVLTSFGFTDNADLSHVRIIRRDEKGRTVKEYDFTRWLKPLPGQLPDESQNPVLTDRDVIYVPLKALPGTGNIQVEGDVVHPGTVSVRVGVSTQLREVISLAGGPQPTADHHKVTIRRIGVPQPILVDYDKMEQGDPIHNITMQPDDVVYIPHLDYDQFVNMNGGVVRPGKLPYQRTMTLTQAIAEAGGMALGAREHEGRVFRHLNGADPTRTQVLAFNYKKVRSNQQQDIVLMPGDTVEIPSGVPKPPVDPLAMATSLLSIAFLVDRIATGGSRGGF